MGTDGSAAVATGRRAGRWWVLALVALLAVAVACATDDGEELPEEPGTQAPADGDDPDTDDPDTDDPAEGTAETDQSGAGAALTIVDFAFDPATLEVSAGATVEVVNQDSAAHTVTAEDGSFDLRLEGGEQGTITVEEPGSYAYACAIHPSMVGEVVAG
jgi:plastocyanin